ncbi:MAG: thrombospondin type 3 repeat-containing protein [Hyphomicrobiales bacterium]
MHRPFARALRWPVLAALLLIAGTVPRAYAVEERGWFSLEAGSDLYDPEQALRDAPGIGLRGAGFLNRWIGLEGLYHRSSPDVEFPGTGGATFSHFGAGVIVTPDRYRWTLPYIYGGFGSAKVSRDNGASKSFGAYHAGVGVILRAGERLGFRLDGRDVSYKQTGGPGRDTRVNAFEITGAVTAFWFGRPRDSDEDGVPDKNDKCPDTPRGAVVDATGCPLDSDGDGVYDGLDTCANTPKGAKVDAKGCPIDSDHDGVPDGIDQCDSTAAGVVVDAKGCGIDSDGDGVFDGLDKCPNTPKGAVVDSVGCPIDSDGDSVPDGIDICPATPAGVPVNAGGCPLVHSPYEEELISDWLMRLTDLEFAPDSAKILPQGMARIDSVAAVLKQWPTLKFEIGVHVDDQPEPGYRIPLTALRAKALLRYLFETNPSLDQRNFWITGYGDTDPLVPNTSAANRTLNRRVDFRLVNPNVLSQELEKRRSYGDTPVPPAPGLEPKMPKAPEGQAPPQDGQTAPGGAPSDSTQAAPPGSTPSPAPGDSTRTAPQGGTGGK